MDEEKDRMQRTGGRPATSAAQSPQGPLYTIRDLDRIGPFHKTKLKHEIKTGKLRAYRLGPRLLVITEADYQDYLARNLQQVVTEK